MEWLSEFGAIAAMQGFNGLSVFCVLLLMALGLAIIFGQMGVINMAHGEFLTIGAYTTYVCSSLTAHFAPGFQPYYFFFAIALSFLVAGAIGWLVEWAMISRLYKRPLDTLLATWGLSLVMQQTFRSVFGAREVSAEPPAWLMGSVNFTDAIEIPRNGLFMMALTLLLTAAIFLMLYRSRWGLQVRATVQNRLMSRAVGINTRKVDRMTFALGCGVAGVAGAAFTTIGSTGPTVTSVGVTARPSLSASTPWLNRAAASNDRANSGVERINRGAMGRLLCNEESSMAAEDWGGYTQPDVTAYVI
jgi:urea transport system permease protein